MISSEQDIKQLIDNLKPKFGNIPPEWSSILEELLSIIQQNPSLANDSEIICSIVIFASKLTDANAYKVLASCISKGIGNFHSLWFSAIALVLERQKNYVSALSTFEQANKIHVEPYPFLDLKYNEFKKRMNERFLSIINQKGEFNNVFTLELGTLDDIEYTFNNGSIATRPLSSEAAQAPVMDIFKLTGFNPSSITSTPMNLTAHNSLASINVSSNNASRQDNYVCGYNPDLLTGPDDKECSFEEQRLLSIGIDFIRNRKLIPNLNKQQSNPDSPSSSLILPKKAAKPRKPLQPIEQEIQQPQQSHFLQHPPTESNNSSFSFNGAAKPHSILKKSQTTTSNNSISANNNRNVSINRNSSINNNNNSFSFINSNNNNSENNNNNNSSFQPVAVSPKNSRSPFGVKFGDSAPAGIPEKRRSPTPIFRPSTVLLAGEMVNSNSSNIGNLTIDSKLGERAYLARNANQSFVVKRLTYTDAQNYALSFVNHVQHAKLFALQADPAHQSPDYYITNYYANGDFGTYINLLEKGQIKPDQSVSLFYLLQMALILQQLEINGFIHGEINEKSLLLRISTEEISKKFGLEEQGWKDTGIVLVRCDQIQKISSSATSTLRQMDREAVYNLFIKSSIGQDFAKGGFEQYDCPKSWNKSLWKLIFDTLSTDTTLDPLMAMIIKELEQNCLLLRRKICMFLKKNLM